jgi:hypothetical protein
MKQNNTQHELITEEHRQQTRKQIQRTNVESQKVENIIHYFTTQTSKNNDPYDPDRTPGRPMQPRINLLYEIPNRYNIDLLVSLVEDYTGYDLVSIEKKSIEGEDFTEVEFETENFTPTVHRR